ncbi:MAG: SRPBCC family protein [Flavobacteriales bacterium]
MRALKTLLIILLAVVALAAVLGLTGPKRSEVSRSAMVNAPSDVVYNHANSLQHIAAWSSWGKKDPAMKLTYSGPDGAVGQSGTWEGNSKVGIGSQEIIALEPDRRVELALHIKQPFEAEASADLVLEPIGDSTKVTWTYSAVNNFMNRIYLAFNDMDKMIGPDVEEGISQLKSQAEEDARTKEAEARAKTYRGFTITPVERQETVYAGHRTNVKWGDLDNFLAKELSIVTKAAAKSEVGITGAPTALVYKWDEGGKQVDLFGGLPIDASKGSAIKGCDLVTIPGGKAWMIAYHGDPAGTEEAHKAMDQMLKDKGLELRSPVIEEYMFANTQEPDTGKWITNIYYPVKEVATQPAE